MLLAGCGLERDLEAWNDKYRGGNSTGEGSSGMTNAAGPSGGTDTGTSSSDMGGSGETSTTPETTGAPPESGTLTTGSSASSVGASSDASSEGSTTGSSPGCSETDECDDEKSVDCHACIRDRLVFVTSVNVEGDFGIKPGLDDLCNQLASDAGLLIDHKKRFRPWISTSTQDAIDRFHHSPGRYVLVNGDIFAASWDAIIAGELQHPLNIDENGAEKSDIVWTNTLPDGRAAPNSDHCGDWSVNNQSSSACFGYSTNVDGQWTHATDGTCPTQCGDAAALYCLEFV